MQDTHEEIHLTKIESVFVFGIIGCLLFATWELAHLMVDEWLGDWVQVDVFTRKRVIYYGIAFAASITAVLVTAKGAFEFGRFGKTINRALLWYGTLLLISTIGIFVFDCLPEVLAGFIGAGVFAVAIYIVQRKFFTKERVTRIRLEKGRCFSCGANLLADSLFCSGCGAEVGHKCQACDSLVRLSDKFCSKCGTAVATA
jgi:hypothetical protein